MQIMGPIPGPPGPQGQPGAPGDSSESLEQRIYDLHVPVREMGQEYEGNHGTPSREDESKALILCENIAFLIRHNYIVYGKRIEPNDVSLVTKNWAARKVVGVKVNVAVFVVANGFSNTLLRAIVEKDNNMIDKLSEETDKQLQQFFPGV
ncbi:hypothetical protein N0V86_007979 [Didymella sp. IMI 355093]|nr:hypothetical protein N0V86_007979 [Didymella sp. IMI 355093]